MDARDFRNIVNFEESLKPGCYVLARWTNSGRYFYGKAEVVRVNAQSIRVRLLETVAPDFWGGYPGGHEIVCPRLAIGSGMKQWSANNRVEPLGGF